MRNPGDAYGICGRCDTHVAAHLQPYIYVLQGIMLVLHGWQQYREIVGRLAKKSSRI